MACVYVGVSGGVDSAVSAALLKAAGHDVVGVFIRIWRPEFIDCPWQRDRLDALRVCAALEIPFKEIDCSEEYKTAVIDDMVSQYSRGITPNPDVLCNRHIKFGAFARWARSDGADFVATGHYARTSGGLLYRGVDRNKDQSYFLWQLSSQELATSLFPIASYTKPDVRSMARTFNVPVANKKDSQGLCFVGDITLRDFLGHYITLTKGAVLDERGSVIGEHDGAALYTLGERHGFRVTTRTEAHAPLYVIAINTRHNTIVVSPEKTRSMRTSIELTDTNWIESAAPSGRFLAQARYREEPVACTVQGTTVTFDTAHLAPPGQSLVVYDGEKCLGGGIISA